MFKLRSSFGIINAVIKMKVKLTIVLVALAVIIGLYFMPFTTTTTNSEISGYSFVVPSFTSFDSEEQNNVVFDSLRSSYALSKDVENALAAYESITCKTVTYYYDEMQDITINSATLHAGFPFNSVTYNYQQGNPCLGWSIDDEVAYPYQNLEQLPQELDLEAMVDMGYFVVDQGKALNYERYDRFIVNQNNGILDYLRIVNVLDDQNTVIIDLQFTSDNVIAITLDTSRAQTTVDLALTKLSYDRIASASVDNELLIVAYDGNDSTVEDRVPLVKINIE